MLFVNLLSQPLLYFRITQLEEENCQVTCLRKKVNELENKLSQETALRRETCDQKDRLIDKFRDDLRRAEEDMARLKEEEYKRASMLQQAVMSYMTSVQSSSK